MRGSAAIIILMAGTLAFAQKRDPILVPRRISPRDTTSAKSVNSDAVAVLLKKRGTTSTDLARIERGGTDQPGSHPTTGYRTSGHPTTAHPTSPKNFGVPQNNKNKPMTASNPGKNGGKHIPSVRKKPGKVG